MNEEKARALLGRSIRQDGSLFNELSWLVWDKGHDTATLDASFTADELEAIAWWMRNHLPT